MSTTSRVLVFDATCLNHFARADRLDVLRALLTDDECWTTEVVREELRAGMSQHHPQLSRALEADWLQVTSMAEEAEINLLTVWARRVGAAGTRHLGEASVLAAAEHLGGVAITDDRDAIRVARTQAEIVRVLTPHASRGLATPGWTLDWSCWTTAAHVAHDLLAYAGQVASRPGSGYQLFGGLPYPTSINRLKRAHGS